MVIRSYVRSTDSHCESRSQNILSCVDVSVDAFSFTIGTIPSTNTQGQLIYHKTAMVTSLTTRKKSVNLDQCSPVPITFIFKLTEKLTPRSIANATSKLAVLNHISNCQVFNSNQAIRTNQVSSQLMEKIGTSIFYFGVYLGYFKSRFISVTRAFGFPTQFLLRCFQFSIQPIEMLGIGNFFTIASTQETGDADIDTYLLRCWWQHFNSVVIYQQRNKPPTRWFEFNCNSRRTTSIGQKPRPNYWQRLFTFSKPELIVSILKSRLGKLSRTAITLGFKPRILSSFPPEISKCLLQMPQTLLQRYTANLIEKVQVFGFFPASQQARSLFVINPLLLFIPSFSLGCQSFVVDKPDASHCPSQEIFLRLCWVKTVLVSSFNHSSHYTTQNVNRKALKPCPAFLPSAEPRVSSRKKR